MSESTAKAQLDPEVGEGVSGYITPSDIQDAIGIIYDDFEAGDALRLSLGGGTLSGSLAGTSLSLSSTLAVTGNTTLTGTLNSKVVNDLVTGPASATDNALVRFDGTTGKVVQNSGITVDDSGNVTSNVTVSKSAAAIQASGSGNIDLSAVSSSGGYARLNLDRAAGQFGIVYFKTAGSSRWALLTNDAAESGSNAGSDFAMYSYTDAGGYLNQVLKITRSTGAFTLTGDLTISKASPNVYMSGAGTAQLRIRSTDSTARVMPDAPAGQAAQILFATAGSSRWALQKNGTSESGSNAGSDFVLYSYTDAGAYLSTPLTITRSTGKTTLGSVGATAGLELGSSGPRMMSGTGSPEGSVTAPVGSIWFQSDSTVGVTHWRKATGTGNTGWVVMEGDTGWRNVSASLDGTFLAANPNATLFMRRTGNTVRLSYKAGTSATFTTNYATVYAIPSGFRPGTAYETPLMMLTSAASPGAAFKAAYFDGGALKSGNTWATATQYWGDATYTTNDAWPTSLPGSAA